MARILPTVLFLFLTFLPGAVRAEIYSWIDDQGTQHYTTQIRKYPEPYRSTAQTLSLPQSPAPPPELLPTPAAKGLTRISFTSGSPVLVTARINGAGPVTLILDTGADRTLVKTSVLSNLGISTENSNRVAIKGVTGTSYAIAVWVNSLEVRRSEGGSSSHPRS